MKILVGSKNASKINGIKLAFEEYFNDIEVLGVDVNSDVSKQPKNDEILKGARNRIKNLVKYANDNKLECDYYVSIEAGLLYEFDKWFVTAISCVVDKNNIESLGIGDTFLVPDRYVKDILENDLGIICKKIFNNIDSGTIDVLTKGKYTRTELNKNATLMALTMLINGSKWN